MYPNSRIVKDAKKQTSPIMILRKATDGSDDYYVEGKDPTFRAFISKDTRDSIVRGEGVTIHI